MTTHQFQQVERGPGRPWRRAVPAAGLAAALLLGACTSSDGEATSGTGGVAGGTAAAVAELPTTTVAAGDPSATEVLDFGSVAVGRIDLDLRDPSRKTPANGDAPEKDGRELPTVVWYPAVGAGSDDPAVTDGADWLDGRRPLIIFSHGVTAKNDFYGGVLPSLVSAGYIVAAPNYPLSNGDAEGGPTVGDVPNQADDIHFLIDQLTNADGPAAVVAEHVADDRIGVAGHSLGAITSLVAGTTEGKPDDRIKAVVSWSGFISGERATDAASKERPVLLIHGTKDGTLPYSLSEGAFEDLIGPRWFLTLPGAGHGETFLSKRQDHPQAAVTMDATKDFLDEFLKDDPKGIENLEAAVTKVGPDVATLQHKP